METFTWEEMQRLSYILGIYATWLRLFMENGYQKGPPVPEADWQQLRKDTGALSEKAFRIGLKTSAP